jgi:hypothetical protein
LDSRAATQTPMLLDEEVWKESGMKVRTNWIQNTPQLQPSLFRLRGSAISA